ncbi:MAG TPA: methyltransferase domain-containing protein [Vicinamibacteria bacterium]|nr:methyltransferase domain-containing protein [Vicinamibacteria bacterium]
MPDPDGGDAFPAWLEALERRHRERLTFAEVRRGLQALSSLYVERRSRLAAGAALEGAGKRAAFALYYGPAHFLLCRAIVRALEAGRPRLRVVLDLGCGTGAAGAAWALEAGASVEGIDRSGWAVEETRWTLARLRVRGSARKGDLAAATLPSPPAGVLAAFTVNELDAAARDALLARLLHGASRGLRVLVVEPLARGAAPWWEQWAGAFEPAGGRQDQWRFEAALPPAVVELGRAAGLDPRALGGRSLFLDGAATGGSPGRAAARAAPR